MNTIASCKGLAPCKGDMSIPRQIVAARRCAARMKRQETEAQRTRREREAKKSAREDLLLSLLPPPDEMPIRIEPVRARLMAQWGVGANTVTEILRGMVESGQVERLGEARSQYTYRRTQ